MHAKRDEHGLTAAQRQFADAYLLDGGRTHAYLIYMQIKPGVTEGAARVQATRMMKDGSPVMSYINARKAQVTAAVVERLEYDQAAWTRDQLEVLQMATGKRPMKKSVKITEEDGSESFRETDVIHTNLAAANTALSNLGKSLGIFSEKRVLAGDEKNPVVAFLQQIAKSSEEASPLPSMPE